MPKRKSNWDLNLILFMFISLAMSLFFIAETFAKGRKARTVYLNENVVTTIWVRPLVGTVLNFPTKPKKAILGASKSFNLEYVDNEIFVAASQSGARTNMHVYVLGRRFSFQLVTSQNRSDEIVNVRDSKEKGMKVELR